jgi:hypothetical protein
MDEVVEYVDIVPHLVRDDLADGAGVLPGRPEAGRDGIGVVAVETQERDDRGCVVIPVSLLEKGLVPAGFDEGFPFTAVGFLQVQGQVPVDLHHAGQIPGPLQISAHPVDGACNA